MDNNFKILLEAVVDEKTSKSTIEKQIQLLNKTLETINLRLDVDSGQIKELQNKLSKLTSVPQKFKVDLEIDKSIKNEIDKFLDSIGLDVKSLTKELSSDVNRFFKSAFDGDFSITDGMVENLVMDLDKATRESSRFVLDIKRDMLQAQKDMASMELGVYEYIKGKGKGSLLSIESSDSLKEVDRFRQALQGIAKLTNDGIPLDTLQKEMHELGLISSDVAEKGLADFAYHIRDCIEKAREINGLKLKDIELPTISVDDQIIDNLSKSFANLRELGEKKIDVDLDISEAKTKVVDLKKELQKIQDDGYTKGKTSTTYDVLNGESIKKTVTEYNNGLEKTIRLIEARNAKTQEVISLDKVEVDNIAKKEKANDKLAKQVREVQLAKEKAYAKIDTILKANEGADVDGANKLKIALDNVDNSAEDAKLQIRELGASIDRFSADAKMASTNTNSLGDSIKRMFIGFSFYDVIQLAKRGISSAVDEVRQLDSSLVELRKVSNLSEAGLESFTNQAYELGATVGRTGREMIDATTALARAGYNLSESMRLGELSLSMANVGEGLDDVTQNASTLISIMKGFGEGVDFAEKSLSVLNEVSNTSAINMADLAEGFTRTSAVFSQSGVSIEQLSGLLVGTNEVMQNIEKSSSGLITVSQRLRQVTEAFEEDPENISKLDKAFREIAGINIRDTNGQIRDTYSILEDMSKVLPTLTTNQRQYLLELAAGKRQVNVLQSLLGNWQSVEKAVKSATESQGSYQKEQEIFLNSIEGKVNQLSSAWQQLATNFISGDFVKSVVDITTGFVKLTDKVGVLNVALLATATYLYFSKNPLIVGNISAMSSAFTSLAASVGLSNVALLGIAGVIGAGVFAGVKVFDAVTVSVEELKEEADRTATKIDDIKTKLSELRNLPMSEEQNKQIIALENELELREAILKATQEKIAQDAVFGGFSFDKLFKFDLDGMNGQFGEAKKISGEVIEQSIAYKALENSLSDLNKSEKERIAIYDELESKRSSGLLSVGELVRANEKLKENVKYLTGEERDQILAQIESNERAIETAKNLIGVSNAKDELATSTSNAKDSIVDFGKSLADLNAEILSTTDDIEIIDKALIDMANGNIINADTLIDLINKYPELRDQLEKTEEGYVINKEALEVLRQQSIKSAEDMISSEITHATQAIESCKNRIAGYQAEIEAIKKLAQAKLTLTSLENSNKKLMSGGKMITPGDVISEQEKRDIAEQEKLIAQQERAMGDLVDKLNDLEITKQDFEIKVANGLDFNLNKETSKKNGSSGSGSKASDLAKEIKDQLQKELDTIQKDRLEVDYKIDFLSAKLDVATLKGDQKEIESLSNQMTELLSKRKELTEAENVQYNALKKKFSDSESLIAIESLMQSNSIEWWSDRKNQLQQESDMLERQIELISEKYELENKAINDRLRDIELEQMMMNDSSDDYAVLQAEKLSLIKQQQNLVLDQMNELRSTNISETSKELEDLKSLYYDYQRDLNNMTKTMAEQRRKIELDAINEQIKNLENQKSAIEDRNKIVMDMIKHEADARKKQIQDEIDGYQTIINKKKDSLQSEKDNRDYQKGLKERENAIKKTEDKILALSNDGSAKAQAEKARLEEELLSLREDLSDYQYDKSVQQQQDRLDEEYENFKSEKDKEIELIDDFLSKEGKIREEALRLIESNNKELYEKLKRWSAEYTTTSMEDLDEMWTTANDAVEEYSKSNQSLLEVMRQITEELKKQQSLQESANNSTWQDYAGNSNSQQGGGGTNPNADVIKKMKDNSGKWATASVAEKDRLSDENQRLGKSIGAYYDDKTGVWYIDSSKKKKLYDTIGVYHTGGIAGVDNMRSVGGVSINPQTEVFAKLMKGEPIITQGQAYNFIEKTLPNLIRSGSTGDIKIDKFVDITVQGNLDKSIDIESIIKRASSQAIDRLMNSLSNSGLNPRIGF